MDFDRLRAFVWTLEEGGVSAAAKRLCRTQPAVTRMLQALEDQVGAELIDRRARPIRATSAGLRVLTHAREILQAADRLTESRQRAESRHLLRLGVSRSLLWQLRDPRFVAAEARKDTDFIIRSGWSPRLYRRFARGEFDGAIILMPSGWTPDVPCRSELLRSEPLWLVGPRQAPAPREVTVTIDDLTRQSWILNPDGCGFRHALARAFASAGFRLDVQFEIDAAPIEHLSMVAAGLGASIVPRLALGQDTELAGQVQRLRSEHFEHELGVWLIWTERCSLASRTHHLLTSIFAAAGPAPRLARATAAR
jgi:DNA-binding transcriptional LysR family regulator